LEAIEESTSKEGPNLNEFDENDNKKIDCEKLLAELMKKFDVIVESHESLIKIR